MHALILAMALTAASPTPPRMALLPAVGAPTMYPVYCMQNGEAHELVMALGVGEGAKKSFQEVNGECHVDAAWLEQDLVFLALIEDLASGDLTVARGSTETGWQERPPVSLSVRNQGIDPALAADTEGGWIAYGDGKGVALRRVFVAEGGIGLGAEEGMAECAGALSVSLASAGGTLAVACTHDTSFRVGFGPDPAGLAWLDAVEIPAEAVAEVVPVEGGFAVVAGDRGWGVDEGSIGDGGPLGEGWGLPAAATSVAAGRGKALVGMPSGPNNMMVVDRLGLVGALQMPGFPDGAAMATVGPAVAAAWRTESGFEIAHTRASGLTMPDRDGDGLDDREDPCPAAAGPSGCPESMPTVAELLEVLPPTTGPPIVAPGGTGGRLLPTRERWYWLTDHGGVYRWEADGGWVHLHDVPRATLVRATSSGEGLWLAGHNGLLLTLEEPQLPPRWRAAPAGEVKDLSVEMYRGDGLAWMLVGREAWLLELDSGRAKEDWKVRAGRGVALAGSRHGCHVLTETGTVKVDQVNQGSPMGEPPAELGALDRVIYSRDWGLFCSPAGAVGIGNHSSGFYKLGTAAEFDLREGSEVAWPGAAARSSGHIVDLGEGTAAGVDESERTIRFWRAPEAIRPWTSQLLPAKGANGTEMLVVLTAVDGALVVPIPMPDELVFPDSEKGLESGMPSSSIQGWLASLDACAADRFDGKYEDVFTAEASLADGGRDVPILPELRYLDAFDRTPDEGLIEVLDELRSLAGGQTVQWPVEGGYALRGAAASIEVVGDAATLHTATRQCAITWSGRSLAALDCPPANP